MFGFSSCCCCSWVSYVLGGLFALCAAIYVFLVWNYDYWRRRNVNGPKPQLLLGSFPNLLRQKQHFADDITDIYKQYKENENFIGVFLMRTPQLMILDPSLVHDVFVNAFKHFMDNDVGKLVDGRKDPLLAHNPFVLCGQNWREQRALITSALSGTRIRAAYAVMQGICHNLCDYIERESKIAGNQGMNGKDLALRFTAENVSDCVLGIKAQSFTPNPLPVPQHIKLLTEDNTIFMIYSLMAGILPSISKLFKVKFFPHESEQFFLKLMHDSFSMRSKQKVDRPDILNHLLELQEKHQLSELELSSHSMTFLIDGLDTTSVVISHCLLLLARDQKRQDKLREEITTNCNGNGQLNYDQISELPYLEACFNETLRIFPPALWSTKTCTERYVFTNKNGRQLIVEPGETLIIPIYALHHDPQYYNEPHRFMPERFLPENGGVKKYRNMGVFLGFGDGPRTCLGIRFALAQSKAALSAIIQKFNVLVNPKTKPLNRLDPKVFLAIQEGGVWLDFEPRA